MFTLHFDIGKVISAQLERSERNKRTSPKVSSFSYFVIIFITNVETAYISFLWKY